MGFVHHLAKSKGDEDVSTGQKKFFILDTNVLLHDPNALFAFGDNTVIIPIKVIEEVDKFKRDLTETGKSARTFCRMLDAMRQFGSLANGVPLQVAVDAILPNKSKKVQGELRVFIRDVSAETENLFRAANDADLQILMAAIDLAKTHKRVVLVTKDVNFRVRADAYGITAVDYESESQVDIDELYSGWRDLKLSAEDLSLFYKKRELTIEQWEEAPHANEYFVLRDRENDKNTALAKWDSHQKKIVPIIELAKGLWGVQPRNKEQRFAIDMLMNDQIQLITLVGKAGTGKTMLALAAGLTKVLDENVYTKMLVSRSIFPLGRDLGALPGELEEKLRPWMQPIFDNFEFLLSSKSAGRDRRVSYKTIMEFGEVEIEALSYIRGRTIPNQWLVVDEAQNLTPHEIKTIVTRAGEGTKVILTGDPYQIDNPYIDASNNAITFVAEKFKNEALGAHIFMTKGERSPLAELASNIL
ncbi:MAG: PhoH family protein [Deltaproteobacteria bacterium]|nr:PhoH family protein [Deltaproteobacteria bacterium]